MFNYSHFTIFIINNCELIYTFAISKLNNTMGNNNTTIIDKQINDLKKQIETYGIIVKKVNNTFIGTNNYDAPIKPGVISLILIEGGEGVISINETDYKIEDNSLIILLPNYCIREKSSLRIPQDGYMVLISIEAITNLAIKTEYIIPIFMMFRNFPIINLSLEEKSILFKYFELLYNEEKEVNSEINILICSNIIQSLTYKISEILQKKFIGRFEINGKKSSIRIFQEFIKLASNEFKIHRDVAYYANKLCVTPKYLSTIVKEISKNRASCWIEILVISEAKNLLHYSDMTIQEIAYSLNFPNPSFFGAYFKKYTGMTPGEYRKR